MKTQSCLSWQLRRLTLTVLALSGAVFPVAQAEARRPRAAGTIRIWSWEFDRGNARVSENRGLYGDYRDKHPDLILTGGDKLPWGVEYDINFPVTTTYTLRMRYASAGVRPLEVWIDDKRVGTACHKETCNPPPYPDRHPPVWKGLPERTWDQHGAEWEESCKFQVTKGKHTLKFTRNGPPANPIEILLESGVAFPKGSKPPRIHTLDLGRIPPAYRRVFLPPDSVVPAALRLAIKDHIRTFGPEYPEGPQYLKQLAELEAKQKAAANGSPEQLQELHDGLTAFRRQVMLAHPALKFDKLLFVRRKHRGSSSYTGHYNHSNPGGNLCILSPVRPDGKVTELAPELAGGLFGRFDLSFDATRIVFAYSKDEKQFRIYEIGIDPSKGVMVPGSLRQLTFGGDSEADTMRHYSGNFCGGGFDDVDPCYLPSGKIMFASSRSQRSVLCFPATVTTLHVMDADGKNIRCISRGQVNEMNPCVMSDGRVVYMRWEYIDKGFGNAQSLWAVRPDGSGSDHVYKNTLIRPATMINACSIPDSRKFVAIGAGHHGGMEGPVIVVDTRRQRRTADAMTNITPEISYPGMGPMPGNGGRFKEPHPFSEKFFLVTHQPGGIKYNAGASYGLYVLDAWGNRTELYRDPNISCYQPTPLRPRRSPTEIPPVARTDEEKDRKLATMFMLDVYQGLTGVERGRVKYVRVMEAMNLSWYDTWRAGKQGDGAGMQASAVSLGGDVARKKVYGIATVHDDGSAFFTVPANKNIFFQALDENYMELQRMRTFLNLMPGENRSCIGCHEVRRQAPETRSARPMAMKHPIAALRPQPGDTGPRAVHYAADVQPILNKHCVGCHGSKAPKGDLDLTGGLTQMWNRSYENLTRKQLVSYLHTCSYGSSHVPAEPPLTFGSHRSKLVERIRRAPCKSKITREDFIKIVTWIDANAPYYGTHRGKKNLKWKDEADFRPFPLAAK